MNETLHNIERDPDDTFDQVLRAELFWQAPPDLTSRVLACIPGAAASTALPDTAPACEEARPQTWYTVLVTILTALAVGLSLAVAWQFYTIVGTELGLSALWSDLQLMVNTWFAQLASEWPIVHALVDLVTIIRNQLHWLLIAIVLWLALDGGSPPRVALQQQQASGSS